MIGDLCKECQHGKDYKCKDGFSGLYSCKDIYDPRYIKLTPVTPELKFCPVCSEILRDNGSCPHCRMGGF